MPTTQTSTHCPHCGARLPEQPLSICSYCAMPLGLDEGKATTGGPSPNAARIAKVEQHEAFAQALEWTPPESREFYDAMDRIFRGRWFVALAVVVLVVHAAARSPEAGGSFWLSPLSIGMLALAGAGGAYWISGTRARSAATRLPLLKRPGMIVDRRSDTRIAGWRGDTTYHFKIELAEGLVAEFSYPGRGAQEEPYPTNLPGVAYTRGTRLLAFRHIRV